METKFRNKICLCKTTTNGLTPLIHMERNVTPRLAHANPHTGRQRLHRTKSTAIGSATERLKMLKPSNTPAINSRVRKKETADATRNTKSRIESPPTASEKEIGRKLRNTAAGNQPRNFSRVLRYGYSMRTPNASSARLMASITK